MTMDEETIALGNTANVLNKSWFNALKKFLPENTFEFTALEVLTFSREASSLHFGEYPAKVHWPNVPPAVSNPTCVIVKDVLGDSDWTLVDICTVRSQAASGNINIQDMLNILKKDPALQKAVRTYLIATIEYFTRANVYPVWGQKALESLKTMNLDVEVFPIAHPSPHGNRKSDNHHGQVIHDLHRCIR
jgi:hypothetical protein